MPRTTLRTAAGTGTGAIGVHDTSQLPISGGFTVLVGDELMTCSGFGGTHHSNATITVTARSVLGSGVATNHAIGTTVYVWKQDEGRIGYPNTKNYVLGLARTRAFEHNTGTNSATYINGAFKPTTARHQHYLFDVRMLCKLTCGTPFTATKWLTNGARIKGSVSGATGIVYIPPQDETFETPDHVNHPGSSAGGTTAELSTGGTANATVTISGGLGGYEPGQGIVDHESNNFDIIDEDSYIVSIDSATNVTLSKPTLQANKYVSIRVGNTTGSGEGAKYVRGTTFHVIQTTGTFVSTDVITSNVTGDLTGGISLGAAAIYYNMGDVHQLYSKQSTTDKSYWANVYPTDVKTLKGTISTPTSVTPPTNIIKGTNTGFTSDLKVGDLFECQDTSGIVHRMEVKIITNDTELFTVEQFPVSVTSSTILRVRSKLEEQEELVMITKLPKQAVKTLKSASLNSLSDTTLKVRRQTTLDFSSSTTAVISLAEGEIFSSFSTDDYQLSVVGGSNASYPIGTVLAPEESGSGCVLSFNSSRTGLTITLPSSQAILKVTYTVAVAVAKEKTKTLQPMKTLTLTNATGGIWGTNFQDDEICLGTADIFKVRAIYEGADASTAPVLPKITYGPTGGGTVQASDLFQPGQKITTTTAGSGAVARVIDGGSVGSTNQITLSYLTDIQFVVGDVLSTTQSSPASQTVSAVVAGDSNILSNFTVDDGMRDTFYDLGRIARKPGLAPPDGQITIVYEYFTHGAGDFFSVDSYPTGSGISDIDYGEIPLYSAQRVDPDTISPSGEYDLRDAVDFRPRVGDYDFSTYSSANSVIHASGTDWKGVALACSHCTVGTGKSTSPYSFAYRNFGLASSSLTDVPKSDDTFLSSFDYYLPQNGALFLDSEGNFKTVLGGAAENPEKPSPIQDAMHLADFRLPQYTFSPSDIGVLKKKNRRFTMKDIGSIADRVENLEYYTQLNMLEKTTESFQMQDADGLDRFKNGFIVDNFTGHKVGNGMHLDYQCSMDFAQGVLRPEFKHRVIEMEESVSTDTLRTTAGYQKTGALLTLPYTETTFINQPYASRIENVNPFNVIAWIGTLDLDPASDIWKDTNRMPNLIINREGNYDTFVARAGGSAINTVWNEWETFWTGEDVNVTQWRDTTWATARAQVPFRRVMETTVNTTTEKLSRTGVRTEITPRIDYESKGDRLVSTDILPYCRAKDVKFNGSVFKPGTRLYSFFDNINVSKYITPDVPYVNYYSTTSEISTANNTTITVTSTVAFSSTGTLSINGETITYSGKSSTTFTGCSTHAEIAANTYVYKLPEMGDPLITGVTGRHSGTFSIPDPNVSGNPAFKVGERILRMTSDQENGILSGDTQTAGEATYYAKGLLDNIQETIIATRNADVNRVTLNQERTVTSTRSSDRQVGWWDPVAQSFLIDEKGGAFITSVDVYFQNKSETVPAQCQIRTMKGGYPTTTILPFGQAAVEPSEVQVSEDASLATNFKFPSPVYLQQDIEYCFVIMANTQDYLIWLSHMGDTEVGGTRTISDQPYAGVLFKSQNASTWAAAQMEDLKFKVNRASFSTTSGTVTLQNQALSSTTLPSAPITTIPGTKKIRVSHPNHGMYASTTNNVTMSALVGSAPIGTGSDTYDLATLGSFTKNNLSEVGLDHYIIDTTGLSNAPTANFKAANAKVTGGSGVQATENYMMDTGKLIVQLMEVSGTDITTKVRTTTGTSASATAGSGSYSGTSGGSETSFNLDAWTNAKEITPNENIYFEDPVMIASTINESLEMSNNKSLQAQLTLSTDVENLSPVIDTQRMGMIAVQNRINNIKRDQDLYSTAVLNSSSTFSDAYNPSTAATGDANKAVYITRKITLANASTALKVIFDAVRFNTASIDVYYKILRADDTSTFDDIEWVSMTADKTISDSKSVLDYREYTYESSGLDSFIAFAIKLVMRGTKSTEQPMIKDFRAIALAI